MSDNTWLENSQYVIKSIDRMTSAIEKLDGKINTLSENVTTIKVKVGVLSALAGGVAGAFISITTAIIKS